MNKFFLILFLAVVMAGCGQPNRYDLAEKEMIQRATNDVVGFTRMIKAELDYKSLDTTNWKGNVTAEFINANGGITRTDLVYAFYFFTNDGRVSVLAQIDPAWEYKLNTEKLDRAMGRTKE